MAKKVITITIDEGVYQTLRSKGENISGLINDYLITYSGVSREELEKKKVIKELEKKKAELAVLEDNLVKIQEKEEEKKKEEIKRLGVPFKIDN